MKSERTIKGKSFYRHGKEKSFHHFVLKLDHQISPFGFCQVKKKHGEKNVNSLLFSVYKNGVTGGTVVVARELIPLPFSILQQNPQGNRQPNGGKGKTPRAAPPTAARGTPPTAPAARRRPRPPT